MAKGQGGWIRFENTTPDNLKLATLSDRAFRLWFNACCYCSRAQSNGRVPAVLVTKLSRTGTRRAVEELVVAGLLEVVDEGTYEVHDYLTYNPSRERIAELRESNRRRVSGWRSEHHGNADVTHYSHAQGARDRTDRETTTNENNQGLGESKPERARTKRADQDNLPDSFPADLEPIAQEVLRVLDAMQSERGGCVPTLRGVGLAIRRFPDRDHLAVVRDLEQWALAGVGQCRAIKDWAKQYATFLGNAAPGRPVRVGGSQNARATSLNRMNRWTQATEYQRGSA